MISESKRRRGKSGVRVEERGGKEKRKGKGVEEWRREKERKIGKK